ncbi:MAG: FHA domain-containing protein [Burkholderiales bacterium]
MSSQQASRRHARIERRRDKFVIADNSTNGTFGRFEDDREWLLHHEELALRETGVIRCGVPIKSEGAETFRFRTE